MTSDAVQPAIRWPQARESWLVRRFGPAWPLYLLLVWFPVWWALGMGGFIFILTAAIMAVQMVRRGRIRVPAGFGVWVLFLLWMLAGVFVLWAHAPGTIDGGGPGRLVGFSFRVLWYLAVTVAMLYPLSLPSKVLPATKVADWLAVLFVVSATGGIVGLLLPNLEFTSITELIIPGGRSNEFIRSLTHPSVATQTDFLGYEAPRPKSPFQYANAWGNNMGLLLPFFVWAWAVSRHRWRRAAIPVVLVLAAIPIALSLNRGLWLGLCVLVVCVALALARARRYTALIALCACALVAAVALMASPLGQTITLRLETPHSNERRSSVAEVVTKTTWEGSPILGFGTTRKVQGSFSSIAGGETPKCRQCAAPPLGTQGFMWRLVFTTGFVGAALFLTFIVIQLVKHLPRRDLVSTVGCTLILMSLLFFMVYDSLESPLFILALAIGLMNRARIEDQESLTHDQPPPVRQPAGVPA